MEISASLYVSDRNVKNKVVIHKEIHPCELIYKAIAKLKICINFAHNIYYSGAEVKPVGSVGAEE
jgi:hypothetical protein